MWHIHLLTSAHFPLPCLFRKGTVVKTPFRSLVCSPFKHFADSLKVFKTNYFGMLHNLVFGPGWIHACQLSVDCSGRSLHFHWCWVTRCVGQLHCQASHSGGGFTVRLPTAEVAAGVVSLSGDPQQRWLHGKVTHSGIHSFTAAWPTVEVIPLLGDSQRKWQLHCQMTDSGGGFTVGWPMVDMASLWGDPQWRWLHCHCRVTHYGRG